MRKLLVLALLLFVHSAITAQSKITSPKAFLGYVLGEAFTPHHKVEKYFGILADESASALIKTYGETYEGRSLNVLFISSEDNIENLETIRTNNLKKAGLLPGEPEMDGKIIVWLSYGVHGNEASSTEAAMATVYKLLKGDDEMVKAWLENTVVVIDPCLNPDGRDRYVNWYKENRSDMLLTNPLGADHRESWPGGRMNHYLFDLNRDWTWLSQIETKYRMKLYNDWLPQIHVDYHEQGYNNPYYFAPADQPYHALISNWQKKFQDDIGKNHAKYFDENNWLYFTKEVFDLFYPGYGDTYPTFNGGIGMTYEQAGSGRAGLGIKTETGDTLTLKDRILHHFTTGISTIEVSSNNASALEENFVQFFSNAREEVSDGYNTFIVRHEKGNNKIIKLIELLDQHKIQYGHSNNPKTVKGYDYHNSKNVSISVRESDLIIPVQQPKSVLVRVLFEPVSNLVDSLTYDITAWSIPFAYGLETYGTNQVIKIDTKNFDSGSVSELKTTDQPYAYAFTRQDINDLNLLSELLQKGLNVRTNYKPITNNGKKWPFGSFFVLSGDNKNFIGNLSKVITDFSKKHNVEIDLLKTGYSEKGPDLGSSNLKLLDNKLKVGVLYGENVSPYSVGEIWHLFEQELRYPLIRLNTSYFNRIDLNDLDVIIIPQGYYSSLLNEDILNRLDGWVKSGGRLVLIGSALRYFADNESFVLKKFLDDEEKERIEDLKEKEDYLRKYDENERFNIKDKIRGGIYRARFDNSHPIGFGYPDYYFTLKTLEDRYAILDKGWNVATITGSQDKVSGFSGSNSDSKTYKSLIVGMEDKGAGEVVYFVDNLLFRSFWENGKLMFCNAIFIPK